MNFVEILTFFVRLAPKKNWLQKKLSYVRKIFRYYLESKHTKYFFTIFYYFFTKCFWSKNKCNKFSQGKSKWLLDAQYILCFRSNSWSFYSSFVICYQLLYAEFENVQVIATGHRWPIWGLWPKTRYRQTGLL